jgi:hypothetical protein
MQIATANDFQPDALLQRITDSKMVRIIEHVRGDSFTSIHEGVTVEIEVQSRDAHCYELISDNATQYFADKSKGA